jgi:hydroxyacylglutathione hydrolase
MAADPRHTRQLDVQRCVVGPLQTNCYVVRAPGSCRAIVIDPGADGTALVAATEGLHVVAIVLTHAHFDHVMGVPALLDRYDTPVYAHAAEQAVWRHELAHLDRYGHFDAGTATETLLAADPSSLHPHGPMWDGRFRPIRPDQAWTLDAGVTVAAQHTPGHTPGGMTFRAAGHLWTGDTLFPGGPGLTGWPLSDFSAIMISVRELLQQDPATIIEPGHGRPTSVCAERPHVEEWQRRGW